MLDSQGNAFSYFGDVRPEKRKHARVGSEMGPCSRIVPVVVSALGPLIGIPPGLVFLSTGSARPEISPDPEPLVHLDSRRRFGLVPLSLILPPVSGGGSITGPFADQAQGPTRPSQGGLRGLGCHSWVSSPPAPAAPFQPGAPQCLSRKLGRTRFGRSSRPTSMRRSRPALARWRTEPWGSITAGRRCPRLWP